MPDSITPIRGTATPVANTFEGRPMARKDPPRRAGALKGGEGRVDQSYRDQLRRAGDEWLAGDAGRVASAYPFASPRVGGRVLWTSRTMEALSDEFRKRLTDRRESGADTKLEDMWLAAADVVDPALRRDWARPGAIDWRRPGQIMWRTAMDAATKEVHDRVDWRDDANTIRGEVVDQVQKLLPEADADAQMVIREGVHSMHAGEANDPFRRAAARRD